MRPPYWRGFSQRRWWRGGGGDTDGIYLISVDKYGCWTFCGTFYHHNILQGSPHVWIRRHTVCAELPIMAGQSKLAADEAEDSVGHLGRNPRRLVKQAWQLYKEDNTSEEAVSICKQLSSYPRLGDAHKAACHLLIAQTTHQETTSLKF